LNKHFLILNKNNNNYLFSILNNALLPTALKEANELGQHVCIVTNSQRCGLIDSLGSFIIDSSYSKIELFNDNIYKVQSSMRKWGLLKLGKKELLIPCLYEEIDPLSGPIAGIKLNNLYGFVNKDGELTLNPSINSFVYGFNNIKYYENEKVTILNFDENGFFYDKTVYNNFKSIRIDGSASYDSNTRLGQTNRNPLLINDSLIWEINSKTKFGIMNIYSGKYVLNPIYDRVLNYPSLGITLAEIQKSNLTSISINGASPEIMSAWVIISNSLAIPITLPNFIHIEINDFLVDSLPVARCLLLNGKYGLIDRKGKIISSGFVYIGKFCEGMAICSKKGELEFDKNNRKKEKLIGADEFFNNLLCRFILHGDIKNVLKESAITSKSGEWGYINTEGKWVIDGSKYRYEFAGNFKNNRAIVRKNKKWGMIDQLGSIVLPLIYEELTFIPNSDSQLYYMTLRAEKFGYINSMAKLVLPLSYDKISDYKENMIAICKGNLWGFADEYGNEIIPCQYRAVSDFSGGLAAVSIKGKWGYINKSGQLVIAAQFFKAADFSEGLAYVKTMNGKVVYIDQSGNVVLDLNLNDAGNFKNGIAKALVRGKGWALIDNKGNFVAKPKSNLLHISEFDVNGLAKIIVKDKGYAILNQSGEIITKKFYYEINNFSEGYAVVRKKVGKISFSGLIDTNGTETSKTNKSRLGPVNNGRTVFQDKSKYGYMDPHGKIIVPAIYLKAENFCNSKAIVYKTHNQSGIIDTAGNYVIAPNVSKILEMNDELALVMSPKFDYYFLGGDLKRHNSENYSAAKNFSNGVAPVRKTDKWSLINTRGFELTSSKFKEIEKFNNGYAKVKISSKIGIADKNGKIIAEPEYDFINYFSDDLIRVEKDNSIGYINVSGNWVWKTEK
jgi:hypothetical protein